MQSIQPLPVHIRISKQCPNLLEIFEPEEFEPPIDVWTEEFSTGVHDLRTALDALALEIAYVDTGHVDDESRIAFPIVYAEESPAAQETKWIRNHTVRELSQSTPESLMLRIKACQTWSSPDTYTENFLTVLSTLDNEDKHRFGCQINLLPCRLWGFPLFQWVDRADEEERQKPWIQVAFEQPAPPCQVVVDLQDDLIPMVSFGESSAHLFDLQTSLFSDTQRYIQFIATGKWTDRAPLILHGTYPIIMDGNIPNVQRLQFTRFNEP